MIRNFVLPILAAFLLSACQTDSASSSSWNGAGPGDLTNGRPSINKTQPILTAALLNNSRLSPMIDEGDRTSAARAETRAYTAPIGQKITWTNPENGNGGTITPLRDGYTANGNYCREFQQSLTVGSQSLQAYNKACQEADGTWNVIQ